MNKETLVTIDKHEYKIGHLDVLVQFHVARRLSPILGLVRKTIKLKEGAVLNQNDPIPEDAIELNLKPMIELISTMKNEDADFIINSCLGVCYRKEGNAWSPMMKNNVLMYNDMDLTTMLGLTFNVVKANLGSFFTIGQSILGGAL